MKTFSYILNLLTAALERSSFSKNARYSRVLQSSPMQFKLLQCTSRYFQADRARPRQTKTYQGRPWHSKTPFFKFFSDSSSPHQHWSTFCLATLYSNRHNLAYPPSPPSSAIVSIWLTPSLPPAADVICGQPLTLMTILEIKRCN